ncbi:MAG: histidinol dehydrogenase, partial [Candidatus Gracilibacteria bacterium]|nr:histidinol dehydrogenase [Candidatus Gracilibacteria bacterium]
FRVSEAEIDEADQYIDDDLKKAIAIATENIYAFHERQRPKDLEPEETSKGVYCWRQFRPIEKVGLYIPGGTAPLFSTLIMLAVPAIIVGCRDIKICTPVNKDGKVAPEVLYTAKTLGIRNIFKIGGAQAIFAMGYGTEQVDKVDKIFGPGNAYVTEAKMRISKTCAIDMPAGPSEVLVIADEKANARYVAADLLSQCEHGPDSQSVLVSNCRNKIREILSECQAQLQNLPRKEIAKKSLQNSFALLVDNMDEAIRISNDYAPEHLILQMQSWKQYVNKIINAGSVFCGEYAPESAGDYGSGTNHTLPTGGFARSNSGIGLESFGKWITFQELTREGLQNIGPSIEKMASSEGLEAHKNAVSVRF